MNLVFLHFEAQKCQNLSLFHSFMSVAGFSQSGVSQEWKLCVWCSCFLMPHSMDSDACGEAWPPAAAPTLPSVITQSLFTREPGTGAQTCVLLLQSHNRCIDLCDTELLKGPFVLTFSPGTHGNICRERFLCHGSNQTDILFDKNYVIFR